LVEFVYAQGGGDGVDERKRARGAEIVERENCEDCHSLDGKSAGDGVPNLGGRGTVGWLARMIHDASDPALFDGKNEMPRFAGKLSDDDVAALAALLRAERAK